MDTALADKFAITELLYRYNSTVDRRDYQGWADCFAAGGVFDGAYKKFRIPEDLDQFIAMSESIMADAPNIRHYVTNISIRLDQGAAKAESFLLLTTTSPAAENGVVPDSRIIQCGVYYDDLVRQDGEWKIKTRRVSIDGAPAGEKPSWSVDG